MSRGEINTFSDDAMRRIAREIFREERQAESMSRQYSRTFDSVGGDAPAPRGVLFYNASSETVPPYGVMEVSSYGTRAGVGYFTITKPTTKRDSCMWLVNQAQPVAAGAYGYGTWATEPTPVMVDPSYNDGGAPHNIAPYISDWYLHADPASGYSTNNTSAYGFRLFRGVSSLSTVQSHPTYTYAYASGSSALRFLICTQMVEPCEISETFDLDGLNNAGWTSSSSQKLYAPDDDGWLSAVTASAANTGYRLGWKSDGDNDPFSNGTIQRVRLTDNASWYRFFLTVEFTLYQESAPTGGTVSKTTASSTVAHTHDLSGHTHAGPGPTPDTTGAATSTSHTHTVDVPNPPSYLSGVFFEVVQNYDGGSANAIYREALTPFGVSSYITRTVLWEPITFNTWSNSGYTDLGFGLRLTSTNHSLTLTSAKLLVIRVGDYKVRQ